MEFIMLHKVEFLALLLAISEVLALLPSVKSNSIFQLVVGVLSKFLPKDAPAQPPQA